LKKVSIERMLVFVIVFEKRAFRNGEAIKKLLVRNYFDDSFLSLCFQISSAKTYCSPVSSPI